MAMIEELANKYARAVAETQKAELNFDLASDSYHSWADAVHVAHEAENIALRQLTDAARSNITEQEVRG